jgi:NTE family protein
MIPSKNKKIGLALGSGSARGFAHIGVIKVLERNNIPIDLIAGSSIGALVGGIYAATKDIAYIEKLALDTDWLHMIKLLDPAFGSGFIAGDKVKKFIHESLRGASFSDLKIPFSVVATDIVAGEPVIFREGDLAEAIRASVSIPFIFHTVSHGEKILCDGALSMPVPVPAARRMGAEYTIAVDLDSGYFKEDHPRPKDNLMDMSNNVVMLLSSHLAKENMREADLILTPSLGDVEWSAFGSRKATADLIARGEKIMEDALPRYFETMKPKTFGKRLKEFLNQPL